MRLGWDWREGGCLEKDDDESAWVAFVGWKIKFEDEDGCVGWGVGDSEATKVGQGAGTGSPCHPSSQLRNSN